MPAVRPRRTRRVFLRHGKKMSGGAVATRRDERIRDARKELRLGRSLIGLNLPRRTGSPDPFSTPFVHADDRAEKRKCSDWQRWGAASWPRGPPQPSHFSPSRARNSGKKTADWPSCGFQSVETTAESAGCRQIAFCGETLRVCEKCALWRLIFYRAPEIRGTRSRCNYALTGRRRPGARDSIPGETHVTPASRDDGIRENRPRRR